MKKNMQTIDGNTAATHVAYGMSEVKDRKRGPGAVSDPEKHG
ncbi:MAG: hypothetical protein PF503_08885 [Desulfobacula sp.]|jgi:hypothetical protein|nr:hypothetical protein [Desulfobacula sp.]